MNFGDDPPTAPNLEPAGSPPELHIPTKVVKVSNSVELAAFRSDYTSASDLTAIPSDEESHQEGPRSCWEYCVYSLLDNIGAIPLLFGTFVAVVWANVHNESYEDIFGKKAKYHLGPRDCLFGHSINFRFVVNDLFMCIFFGLAGKEVLETLQPGGSLYPPRRAVNPILSCLGGVIGPVTMYVGLCCMFYFIEGFSEDELFTILRGWGVPTATDIALAWVMAVRMFGDEHPAVYYLVVLAILDDALGIMIIAIYYQDPDHPVKPIYLLLVVAGTVVALVLRKVFGAKAPWFVYVWLAGPLTWTGLAKAHVHPALALVFVVPAMPGGEHSPLDQFEHHTKTLIDLGLGLFTLANAGVRFGEPGTLTVSIAASLIFGKPLGIFCFGALGSLLGFPLPIGVTNRDLLEIGAVAGTGLTVALFVSAEAFSDEKLQSQAKLGALLSLFAYPFAVFFNRLRGPVTPEEKDISCLLAEYAEYVNEERWADPVGIGVFDSDRPGRTASKDSYGLEASGSKESRIRRDLLRQNSEGHVRGRKDSQISQLSLPGAAASDCLGSYGQRLSGPRERSNSHDGLFIPERSSDRTITAPPAVGSHHSSGPLFGSGPLIARDGSMTKLHDRKSQPRRRRHRRPSAKMLGAGLIFQEDIQISILTKQLAQRRESQSGRLVDAMARQLIGVLMAPVIGNQRLAFYGWRHVIHENRLLRGEKLLIFSSVQGSLLLGLAFTYWRAVARQNAKRRADDDVC